MFDERKQSLVFIEVRYRKNNNYGGSAVTVNYHKQQKLIKTALHYLQRQKSADFASRFDVIAIDGPLTDNANIEWIENAFDGTY